MQILTKTQKNKNHRCNKSNGRKLDYKEGTIAKQKDIL